MNRFEVTGCDEMTEKSPTFDTTLRPNLFSLAE